MSRGGRKIPVIEPDWKFEKISRIGNYRGTSLAYDMLCEPISSDEEDKELDNITGNCLVNIQNLTANMKKFLVCKKCPQDKALQIKHNSKYIKTN